jgi:hypothetical protein
MTDLSSFEDYFFEDTNEIDPFKPVHSLDTTMSVHTKWVESMCRKAFNAGYSAALRDMKNDKG